MRPTFCSLAILFLWHSVSFADDLNKPRGLSSKSQAKVLGVIAKSYGHNEQSKMFQQQGVSCSPQVGVTNIERGATAPREVTTVIKGDVISVCK